MRESSKSEIKFILTATHEDIIKNHMLLRNAYTDQHAAPVSLKYKAAFGILQFGSRKR